MADKKTVNSKKKPVHVVRCGEVTASIELRQTNAGFSYYTYSLGRCWNTNASGKVSRGSTFFDKNQDDLVQAIKEASQWIREKALPVVADNPGEKTPASL